MAFSLEQYESIQQYLDDKMTPEQENQFMLEVTNNPILQENLQFEIELRESLHLLSNKQKPADIENDAEYKFNDTATILSLVQKAGKEYEQTNPILPSIPAVPLSIKEKKSSKIISLPVWLSIAAAACVLFAVVGIVWYTSNKAGQQSIAKNKVDSTVNKNDNKPDIAVTTPNDSPITKPSHPTIDLAGTFAKYYKRDVPEEKPMLLSAELNDYENEDYLKLQKFDLVNVPELRGPSEDTINTTQHIKELGHYYRGLSFMESKNYPKALSDLKWVIKNGEKKQLVIKAKWYQALIYIKKGTTNEALPLLTSVANSKVMPYNKKAKDLLQLLKP